MDIVFIHFIHTSQVKNLSTSILAFNIIQFFLSLNHQLLPLILTKASIDPKVSSFFQDYLVNRKTRYFWNNFSSLSFNIYIGVSQESALSPFYIFEKWLKNLKIPVFIISFIDNGLCVIQNKSLTVSNLNLFYSYYIISFLLKKFGLIVKYEKTEVFHFSRLYGTFDPPPFHYQEALSLNTRTHSIISGLFLIES